MKIITTFTILLWSAFTAFALSQEEAGKIFKEMLSAQEAHNYDAFVAHANDQLKAALSRTQFDAAAHLITQKLKDGYDLSSLGELHQRGFQVFLYRLRPKTDGDDILATLSIQEGKVGGIWFR